ncbi:hypothetical protein ACFSJS_22840 [Streptomyces desertarenae]|uniref:Uncharacterized protein n=1 Tax=Streptomyces desertarenae TaxID=2666184 RepID=A0ABW4PQU8_9ACTN
MTPRLRRIADAAATAASIAVACLLCFGSPRDWEGGPEWMRYGLPAASVGGVRFGARLMFSGAAKGTADTAPG